MTTATKTTDEPVKKSGNARSKPKATAKSSDTAKLSTAKKTSAAKATAAKKTTKPKTPAAKQADVAPAATQTPTLPELTPEQRRLYVEVAAYYIAERRGFRGGSEMEDWLQAEAEIDRLLREGILKP
ncbi:DUF2934 domain-containing protein [Sulfuricystis multivorans]|uniref:DUF2934 domain-containing protein n=1 Tax=Sulfuricystis multivorans TaxID=2211108 RepID=UPI000F833E7A|nr:DUF2934 domain-containing protein [Sulfuricystis multivorans]